MKRLSIIIALVCALTVISGAEQEEWTLIRNLETGVYRVDSVRYYDCTLCEWRYFRGKPLVYVKHNPDSPSFAYLIYSTKDIEWAGVDIYWVKNAKLI
jgi:hypothetical protein